MNNPVSVTRGQSNRDWIIQSITYISPRTIF